MASAYGDSITYERLAGQLFEQTGWAHPGIPR
jgi:hypothetical protein